MRPDHYETLARKHLIEQVRNHVRETHPPYALEVFGSERTGVAFATSDIDLRLVHQLDLLNSSPDIAAAQKPPGEDKRTALTTELHKIHRNLQSAHPEYVDPTFRWARYPLVALRDRNSGLEVQIVAANDSSISRGCMAKYMAEYPYLGPVYSVVKAMFDVRGLSNVFMGGFGSYSLFMMLVASIKHAPSDRNDAAGALVNFLHFWRHFDTTAHGISIEPVELYNKKEAEAVMSARARKQIRVTSLTSRFLCPY
jgi:non-canonical poly(A) RNA polymerase PAPD5/7